MPRVFIEMDEAEAREILRFLEPASGVPLGIGQSAQYRLLLNLRRLFDRDRNPPRDRVEAMTQRYDAVEEATRLAGRQLSRHPPIWR